MKGRPFIVFLLLLMASATGSHASSMTNRQQMQDSLLQMLARFSQYVKADYQACREPNSVGEACGCFRSNNTMKSNEDGVRTNADLGMICAFLCRYGRDKVTLPADVSWDDLQLMAHRSLVFAYSTHKANRLKVCADGHYWGSTGQADHVWESSLWAMSVAYQAFFLWDQLTASQREHIHRLLRAECQYELERDVPTGYSGDTKAEENGWEANVLAATLGLFPYDELAPQWAERLLLFAVNAYSHPSDMQDTTSVCLVGAKGRVCDLYKGANLYDDYTLQNHNYFHTSYQNVVIQELGEAALALALFSPPSNRPSKEQLQHALLHNCREVCDSVLWWLALSDGELAMPNGNDWSLFLYDQMTSYTTMACLFGDADALFLENRAYQMIRHRQLTTPDGSWLLRSDIGPRRMGVQGHRVMMTWLMHHLWPTDGLRPTAWNDFRQRYAQARLLPCQRVVRASTATRFTCFGWSEGLHSYTGYIAPHQNEDFRPDATNMVVPFKAHNTGNLLGWYEVAGHHTNAIPATEPRFTTDGEAWTLTAHLLCNDSALDCHFALFSTPGNALIYIDNVRANADVDINRERGGIMAVSLDPVSRVERHFCHWQNSVCIDNELGLVGTPGKTISTDPPQNVNSVLTALVAMNGSSHPRSCRRGDVVDQRHLVCYTGVNNQQTRQLASAIRTLDTPDGWRGIVVPDTDGHSYLLLSHFFGDESNCATPYGHFHVESGNSITIQLN